MPRIAARKINYMEADAIKMFKRSMAGNGVTQKLAAVIGLSPSAFCERFKRFDFSWEHLVKMIPVVGLPDEDILKLMKG